MTETSFIFIMLILGTMSLLLILLIVKSIQAMHKGKRLAKENKDKMKNLGQLEKSSFKHVTGLPIAEKIMCDLIYYNDKLEIVSGSHTFNLNFNKITDMIITTDVEIRKQYVSSVGGAVTGAMLFGSLGAIVGGRAKEKKSKQIYKYLVITYMNDDVTNYISFDVTNNLKANNFIKLFHKQENKRDGMVTEL